MVIGLLQPHPEGLGGLVGRGTGFLHLGDIYWHSPMSWSGNCPEAASSRGDCRQGNQGSVCRSPFPAALAPGGSTGVRGTDGFSDLEGKQGFLAHWVLGNSVGSRCGACCPLVAPAPRQPTIWLSLHGMGIRQENPSLTQPLMQEPVRASGSPLTCVLSSVCRVSTFPSWALTISLT